MDVRRIVLAGVVALALMSAGCTSLGFGTPVPDVKGKTPAQAETVINAAGFLMGTVSYDEKAEGAPGAIVAQSPAAGARSQKGAPVNVTLAGAEPVMVPSVVGQSQAAATATLAGLGLKLGAPILDYSDTVASGVVVQQEPVEGTQVPSGTAISVVVSKGLKVVTPPAKLTGVHVKVPAVKGLKLAAAQSKITAAGLKWKHLTGPGDGMTAVGYVYKQSPASGTSVNKGSTVTIYTWVGP